MIDADYRLPESKSEDKVIYRSGLGLSVRVVWDFLGYIMGQFL